MSPSKKTGKIVKSATFQTLCFNSCNSNIQNNDIHKNIIKRVQTENIILLLLKPKTQQKRITEPYGLLLT